MLFNKFQVINGATTIINEEFISDPWIYGNLYNNAWSPYIQPSFSKNKLKKIKYCFISHLHQDHWDLDTIKYFPKKTLFIIPDLIFNRLIEKQLRKIGFKLFKYLKPGKFLKIKNKYMVSVVPPLNSMGQDVPSYKGIYDNDIDLSIDCGVIIKTLNDNNNHLLLADNCPYNLEKFNKYFKKIKIQNCFYPYNGYASDYPIAYSNLSLEEKRLISKKKINYLENKLKLFFNHIKPKVLIPYSSTFSINTKYKNDFFKVNDVNYFETDKYVKKFKEKNNIPCISLNPNDILVNKLDKFVLKRGFPIVKTTVKRKKISLKFENLKVKNIENLFQIVFVRYLERIKKYELNYKNIIKTNFLIQLDGSKDYFFFNFKKQKIEKTKKIIEFKKKRTLILKSSKNIILNILKKKAHINNCIIGIFLDWKRYPNKINSDFDKSLNFFHI
jgi:hypothetical protein